MITLGRAYPVSRAAAGAMRRYNARAIAVSHACSLPSSGSSRCCSSRQPSRRSSWPLLRARAAAGAGRRCAPRPTSIATRSGNSTTSSPPARSRARSAMRSSTSSRRDLARSSRRATPAVATRLAALVVCRRADPRRRHSRRARCVLYAAFGSPAVAARGDARSEAPPMSQEQVVAMVDKLAARMKEHPEDPTGWRLLARAYSAMGRFPESVAAFAEAAARGTGRRVAARRLGRCARDAEPVAAGRAVAARRARARDRSPPPESAVACRDARRSSARITPQRSTNGAS